MLFPKIPLLTLTAKGLYCEQGDFYIDPMKPVDVAVITHAHSDHARRGHKKYICVDSGMELLKTRIGKNITVETYPYGKVFNIGAVKVSLHSAGHILGSAQVRLEYNDEVWVASGDYKRDPDPSCDPFETVTCDYFITEATFGTPRFVWPKALQHGEMISQWWRENETKGMNSILFGYSLGKAQRILAELAHLAHKPVLIDSSIHELTECYRRQNKAMANTELITERLASGKKLMGELILAPPSILEGKWAHDLGQYQTAFASGWMQGWGRNRYDRGFVMSDHADWNDLNMTIRESKAKVVFVQHRDGALVRHLRKNGIAAYPVEELEIENYAPKAGENLVLI